MLQRGLELGQQGWSMNGQRVCVEKSMMLLTRGIGRGIIKKEGKISLKSCYFPDFATLHYGGGNSERTDVSTRCRKSSEIHQVSNLLGGRSGHFNVALLLQKKYTSRRSMAMRGAGSQTSFGMLMGLRRQIL